MSTKSGFYDNLISGDFRCSAIDDDHYKDWDDYFDEVRKHVLKDREQKQCDHQWTTYNGFTEDYKYCELCDIKKDEL